LALNLTLGGTNFTNFPENQMTTVYAFLLHMKQITRSDLLTLGYTGDKCVIANVMTFDGTRSRPMNVNRDTV